MNDDKKRKRGESHFIAIAKYQAVAREEGLCIFCHRKARVRRNGFRAQTCPSCYASQTSRLKKASG